MLHPKAINSMSSPVGRSKVNEKTESSTGWSNEQKKPNPPHIRTNIDAYLCQYNAQTNILNAFYCALSAKLSLFTVRMVDIPSR
jgi:hypothetical protein|tara:strand:+ start:602 stop:853 length:252 start_codon:yes stop_codon:yes gene_type:complete